MPKHLNPTNIRLTADLKKIFKLFEMLPDTFSLAAHSSQKAILLQILTYPY